MSAGWRWPWQRDKLASVTAVPVGRENDGLVGFGPVNRLDKPWQELYMEFEDTREAWRKHPLARRLIGLTTAYVVGNGITLRTEYAPLQRFIADFWRRNDMELRVAEWCDELARSGEIFPVLFWNEADGSATVRTVAASAIDLVDYDPDDYERELRYRERRSPGEPEKWWQSRHTAEAGAPVMLHYAVNRPLGAVRGESDLAPMLPWLRRYSRWLEDRVRVNAAMRAFLWIVRAPARLRGQLEERYRMPPEAGSVIIADTDEQWEAVTPTLHAADAEHDGRAIRWMIVSGGLGTALLDIGEGEDSNLATGQAMAEQRRRFLRRRQSYLGWLLVDMVMLAWNRYAVARRLRVRSLGLEDVTVVAPDISPEDNGQLAAAGATLAGALAEMRGMLGDTPEFRAMALRMFTKFVGESMGQDEANAILAGMVEEDEDGEVA